MIETMTCDGGAVVALRVRGKLTKDDYTTAVVPRLDRAFRAHDTLRLLCVLGEDYEGITPGAVWEDLKIDLRHRRDFDRIAVVSDDGLVRAAVQLSKPLFGGEVRVYRLAEQDAAETWVQTEQPAGSAGAAPERSS